MNLIVLRFSAAKDVHLDLGCTLNIVHLFGFHDFIIKFSKHFFRLTFDKAGISQWS